MKRFIFLPQHGSSAWSGEPVEPSSVPGASSMRKLIPNPRPGLRPNSTSVWLACIFMVVAFLIGLQAPAQTVAATVAAGSGPIALAVNPRTNKIYVADFYGNPDGITIIDGQTNTTKSLATTAGQFAVAVNPLTNMVYFVDAFNYLTVVDGSTDTVVATVTVGADPVAVAVNPATNMIYVASDTGSTVSVVDGSTNKVTATLNLTGGPNLLQGFVPSGIFVNPDTNRIYVTCQSANILIDAMNGNAVSQLSYTGGLVTGGPMGVDPVSDYIFAVDGGSSEVLVIDDQTGALAATVTSNLLAPLDVALNPVTNKAYVLNTLIDDVTAIDGTSFATTLIQDPNAKGPLAVTVNPTTNQIFVANSKSNNVTVINGTTYATTVNVGTDPVAIAANPVTNTVYVANNGSNNVTVITGTGTTQTIPITTTIAPFSGNETSNSAPTFTFSAASTFAPVAPPVEAVYFQLDSMQGTWSKASSTGSGNFSGTATLQSGSHTIYAFATDGQDATSTITGVQSSPLIGSVASYTFSETGSGSPFSASPSPLAFGNQTQGTTSSARTLTVTNSGSTNLSITNVAEGGVDSADFPISSDNCMGATVAAGKTCSLSIKFAPATSAAESATLTFTDNASDSPEVVNLTGTGVVPAATASTTAISASAGSVVVGASVTFTATVAPISGTPTPTGTVTFKDGSTTLGTGTLNGSGVATYATSSLAKGAHSITASYGGDARNLASTSSGLAITVASASTTTTLTASAASVVLGASVTFTANVSGASGTLAPTGSVTFADGMTTLGTGTVNGSGVATYSTTALAAGSHSVTASYGGDANNAASASTATPLTVWPGAPDFTVSLSPGSGSFKAGTKAVVTITVTSVNGFNSATNLSFSGLPKNSTGTFSPNTVTPSVSGTATSTLTIQTDVKASTAAEEAQFRAARGGSSGAARVALAGVAGFVLLLPLMGMRQRALRRHLLSLSALVLFALIFLGGISACGGGPTTPKGTYSIQVTGTGGSTTHAATFSLTVQ